MSKVGLTENFPVFFGRLDSLTASLAEANLRLPKPTFEYNQLKQNFANQSLDENDLVALSGAHTFGRVRCGIVRSFVENVTSNEFRNHLNKTCPINGNEFAVTNFDRKSPDAFDNIYYKNLQVGESILRSDQVLYTAGGRSKEMVKSFANNQAAFFRQYALSSIKMANIKPRKGTRGEIRLNCHRVNPTAAIAFE